MNKPAAVGILCAVLVLSWLVWRGNQPSHSAVGPVASNGKVVRLVEGEPESDAVPARRYRIGVLFPFIASPFWVNEAYGILNQAEKVGVDVKWLSADGYDNIDKQNSQIEAFVSERVDAILIGATSSVGTVASVEHAVKSGVPVFAHVTSSATNVITSAVLDDDASIGRKQGEYMGNALHGQGQVAMLTGPAAADWSSQRTRAFKDVIATKFSGIQIVAERNGIPDRADAQRLTEDLLVAFPDLKGLFTVADGMALGAVDAVTAARRTGVTVTTASFSRESVPYLIDGRIGVNVDESPVLMGRTAINMVIRALNGETVPKVIYVPSPAITRDNLESVNQRRQWAPPDWRLK